jgi:large subunit ribosomal protein L2
MTFLKNRKPTSAGMRHRVDIYHDYIFRGKPFKRLVKGTKKTCGRNNLGLITTRHRGQGNKRRIRMKQDLFPHSDRGLVLRVEYNPKSSGHLALVK